MPTTIELLDIGQQGMPGPQGPPGVSGGITVYGKVIR